MCHPSNLLHRHIWELYWSRDLPGEMQPYMLTCSLPPSHASRTPTAVSVVERRCEKANNLLQMSHEKQEKKKKFGVCMKLFPYGYEGIAEKMVESMEVLARLGADQVFFYHWEADPNATRVMEYYEGQGRASAREMVLPDNLGTMKRLLPRLHRSMSLFKQIEVCYRLIKQQWQQW
jgi:hypothetical protein